MLRRKANERRRVRPCWNIGIGCSFLAGTATSDISGNKTNAAYGGDDCWAIKLAVTEDPIPTILLNTPTNGAKFTAPGQIVINATIGDFDGFVSNVSFYATG